MQGLRRRATAMTLSRSRDGFSPGLRAEMPDDASTDGHEEPMSSPLLLPEPPNTSVLGRLNRSVRTVAIRTSQVTGITSSTVEYFLRLSLFLVKLSTLAQPCWPYMPTLHVAVPLLILATLDLRMSPGQEVHHHRGRSTARAFGSSAGLLLLHASLLWYARSQQALCLAVLHEAWPDW